MRETTTISAIRKLAARQHVNPTLITGIGDDCAVLRPSENEDLLFTSDFVLEDRHFTLKSHTAPDIGHKALARSLSDLAAMGGAPVFCLVSLAVPQALGSRWINRFYGGLLSLAAQHQVTLAGGDIAQFDKVVADVTCCGRVPRGAALLRSTAKPGDLLYVTGSLGGSAQGLASGRGAQWQRHRRPEPRVSAGVALRTLGVSACMDLSDGLSLDLHRLCCESRVSAELDENLPAAPGASLLKTLHGGEDYELLFTAAPRVQIPKLIGGVPVSLIGKITKGKPGLVRYAGRILKPRGFDHFFR